MEKQTHQKASEGDTPLVYFKAECRLSSMQPSLDPNAKKLYDYVNEYAIQSGREFDCTKLMQFPTGYYDSHGSLGKYLEKGICKDSSYQRARRA